jgi:hypothetical protein
MVAHRVYFKLASMPRQRAVSLDPALPVATLPVAIA